jgi:uracil-DNA glycosylase family 4
MSTIFRDAHGNSIEPACRRDADLPCSVCGGRSDACWDCSETDSTLVICRHCALTVLPALIADAIRAKGREQFNEERERMMKTFWRASALAMAREPETLEDMHREHWEAWASVVGREKATILPVIDPPPGSTALLSLAAEVSHCRKCPHLAETRTQTVFADGSPTARLMFIGEAPGADEDRIGVPFVGRAGQLLTDMITGWMGLKRQDVYIANVLKCRPPENREPANNEVANCLGYLERQIDIVRPEFLCLLGRVAVQKVLGTGLSMTRLRGKWYRYRGIPTVVSYHPAFLLCSPARQEEAREDLRMLMNAMGLTPNGATP